MSQRGVYGKERDRTEKIVVSSELKEINIK